MSKRRRIFAQSEVDIDTETVAIRSQALTWNGSTISTGLTMGPFGSTPNNNGATISSGTQTLQPADATHPGGVSTGAQSFAGPWTITNAISASNFSGSSSGANTGDVTVGAFGSTPNNNGLSLAGQVLTAQPADATHPGSVSTTTQTLAGAKTFVNNATFSGLIFNVPVNSTWPSVSAKSIFSKSDATGEYIEGPWETSDNLLLLNNLHEANLTGAWKLLAMGTEDDNQEVTSIDAWKFVHMGALDMSVTSGIIWDTFGTVTATGQACSATVPATIAFGALSRSNNANITVGSNKFLAPSDTTGGGTNGDMSGTWDFAFILKFNAQSVYTITLRSADHGGALANTAFIAAGVTDASGNASDLIKYVNDSIVYGIGIDFDFQIIADSFPTAGTVRSLANTSTITFEFRPLFDTA